MEPPATRARGLGLLLASSIGSFAVGEAVIRVADGGALAQIDCFRQGEGTTRLQPGCTRWIAGDPGPWKLTTDAHGLRASDPTPDKGGWLVAGDSQVLGYGVGADDAWFGRTRGAGFATWPVAVPGHGVGDSIDHALEVWDALQPRGLVVVVNAANDWSEAGRSAGQRFAVRGGWLLPADRSNGLAGAFFGSPLARSHALTTVVQAAAHDWRVDPKAAHFEATPWGMSVEVRRLAAQGIAAELRAFVREHPTTPLRVVLLPVDFATSRARAESVLKPAVLATLTPPPWEDRSPWTELLPMIADIPVIDLRAALGDPNNFQPSNYHLSSVGQGRFAEALLAALEGG